MRLLISRLAIFVAAAAFIGGVANAASYNCAKAKTPDEIAICANSALSDLDTTMATLYGVRMQIPMLMGARGTAQDEQHQFLIDRGACGADVACLKAAYTQRIGELNQTIGDAMHDYCEKLGICG